MKTLTLSLAVWALALPSFAQSVRVPVAFAASVAPWVPALAAMGLAVDLTDTGSVRRAEGVIAFLKGSTPTPEALRHKGLLAGREAVSDALKAVRDSQRRSCAEVLAGALPPAEAYATASTLHSFGNAFLDDAQLRALADALPRLAARAREEGVQEDIERARRRLAEEAKRAGVWAAHVEFVEEGALESLRLDAQRRDGSAFWSGFERSLQRLRDYGGPTDRFLSEVTALKLTHPGLRPSARLRRRRAGVWLDPDDAAYRDYREAPQERESPERVAALPAARALSLDPRVPARSGDVGQLVRYLQGRVARAGAAPFPDVRTLHRLAHEAAGRAARRLGEAVGGFFTSSFVGIVLAPLLSGLGGQSMDARFVYLAGGVCLSIVATYAWRALHARRVARAAVELL
ncbi:MAG: hypothetical protein HY553_19640 [Elusimicrobia bacterium]|nr:hypothetical protein [Elusimicrobiota bacterium]